MQTEVCKWHAFSGVPGGPYGPCVHGLSAGQSLSPPPVHPESTLKPGQTRRLNLSAQTNLAWWDALIESWPGISVQQFLMLRQPDYLIPCDASETWGCGPWCTPHWLQVPWSLPSPTLNSPAGAVPSCDSSCCMGGRLDRPPCPLPFRQCPSSRPGQQATCP